MAPILSHPWAQVQPVLSQAGGQDQKSERPGLSQGHEDRITGLAVGKRLLVMSQGMLQL